MSHSDTERECLVSGTMPGTLVAGARGTRDCIPDAHTEIC